MAQEQLFVCGAAGEAEVVGSGEQGEVRVKRANRSQGVMQATCIDELIPVDHRARALWVLSEKLDLSPFYEPIRSREGEAGRPAIDPRVLLCLWLYATSEGIGSARHLSRLCERDAPYRWLAGGMRINAHTLSDFRVGHEERLNGLLTELLAALMKQGVVRLGRVAQDGCRVRASAGAASFRRESSLKKCLEAARKQVKATRAQLDAPAREESRQKVAAKARAAQEVESRASRALAELEKIRGSRTHSARKRKPEDARASTTDPEARVMRMPDGGYRPAVNVQVATDVESRVVVGVGITQSGSDMNEMTPMLEQIEQRTGRRPDEHLVDGGYVKREAINAAESAGTKIYAPQSKQREGKGSRRWGDGDGVASWRERMATAEAAVTYKDRAATAETVNADLRQWRGLRQMPVRGTGKTLSVVLLMALTYNLMRVVSLGIQL